MAFKKIFLGDIYGDKITKVYVNKQTSQLCQGWITHSHNRRLLESVDGKLSIREAVSGYHGKLITKTTHANLWTGVPCPDIKEVASIARESST